MIPLFKALCYLPAALLLFFYSGANGGTLAHSADRKNDLPADIVFIATKYSQSGGNPLSGTLKTGSDTPLSVLADKPHSVSTDSPHPDTTKANGQHAGIPRNPSHEKNPEHPDSIHPQNPDLVPLERTGKNALYAEILGNGMNVISLNYERSVRRNLHLRIGGSWIGYSDQIRYEDRGEDLFFDIYTIPSTVSYTLFDGFSQLELGGGLTFFSMNFSGGPFDIGYNDVELGNRYKGLAVTGIIGYRVSVHNYLFRIGISPHYMVTIDSEITGFFNELKERGALDLHDFLDFRGFRMVPGVSFGRTF